MLSLAACGGASHARAELAAPQGAAPIHRAYRVAIGPNVGEVGYLDTAWDHQEIGEMGPFLVWDAPTGGHVIAWWYNNLGLRAVGDEPSAAELVAAQMSVASTGSSGSTEIAGQR